MATATTAPVSNQHRSITIKEARKAILRCFQVQRPVMLHSGPGVGKSEVISQIAEEMGGVTVDLRMGTLDISDIRGIPYFDKNSNVMRWAPPEELPSAEFASQYPIVVLFLDELNTAAPAVQASGYQLILNRRVGTYVLPKNVVIVAAGNRESDKGVTYRMPSPLANRFVHLELRVDFDSWLEWAVQNRIHKDVIGFITFSKDSLNDFNPMNSGKAFATPRSWTFVSQFLENATDDSILTELVAGTIGEGLALKFMTHRKIAGQLPNPTDILNGTVTELKSKEISAMYSLVTSMCYELQDAYVKFSEEKKLDKWHAMVDNFLKFCMDVFPAEITVMGVRMALSIYNLPLNPSKLTNYTRFHKAYGRLILLANQ
jgi:hypothetical protein